MRQEIRWQLKTGREAAVIVDLVTARKAWLDGDESPQECCELNIIASVEGAGVVGYGCPAASGRTDGLVAVIGQLGLTEDNLAEVNAAIAAAEATPEWQAHLVNAAVTAADAAAYEKHCREMDRAMGRGKTY